MLKRALATIRSLASRFAGALLSGGRKMTVLGRPDVSPYTHEQRQATLREEPLDDPRPKD
jgi:hypothetical protein